MEVPSNSTHTGLSKELFCSTFCDSPGKTSDMFSFVGTTKGGKRNAMWETWMGSSVRANKETGWEEKEINISGEARGIKRIMKTG